MALETQSRAFIERQRVAHLATVDQAHRPHIVPICFALLDTRLCSVVDEKPKRGDPSNLIRLHNIAINPKVQVLFDVYDDNDWAHLRFVQVRGTARIVLGGETHVAALEALRGRYPQYRTMSLEGRPLISIEIDDVVSWPR